MGSADRARQVNVVRDKSTSACKGYAFVHYLHTNDAAKVSARRPAR
jgi:hypothetical protein